MDPDSTYIWEGTGLIPAVLLVVLQLTVVAAVSRVAAHNVLLLLNGDFRAAFYTSSIPQKTGITVLFLATRKTDSAFKLSFKLYLPNRKTILRGEWFDKSHTVISTVVLYTKTDILVKTTLSCYQSITKCEKNVT